LTSRASLLASLVIDERGPLRSFVTIAETEIWWPAKSGGVSMLNAVFLVHTLSYRPISFRVLSDAIRNTGMPDLLLTLSDAASLEDTSFHPCVRCVWHDMCPSLGGAGGGGAVADYRERSSRLQKWASNRSISFVPPDGRFTLMRYRLGQPSSLSAPGGLGRRGGAIAIPLSLKAKVTVGQAGGELDIRISRHLAQLTLSNAGDSDRFLPPHTHSPTRHPPHRDHRPLLPSRRWRYRRERHRDRRSVPGRRTGE
jgi:Adaptor complexes medium subunit family